MSIYLKKAFLFTLILASCNTVFLTGCTGSSGASTTSSEATSTTPLSRTTYALGTVITISLYDNQSEAILDLAVEKLAKLEDTLSINKTGTLIDEINLSAGKNPVVVDKTTYEVVEKALSYSALTDGAFDITIGPIVKLWNIGFPEARVPSEAEILHTLPLVDYHNVVLNPEDTSIYLTKEGMSLDLGGIGKGYAADEVATLLREQGVNHAIIDLGGNLYTLGNKPGDKPWTIGVQDPFNPRGEIIGTLQTENQSIVTSGIYERYLEDETGNTYHHILNPKTGYPFDNEIAGVTIISDTSIDGDALSTSVFALGLENGLTFIENMNSVEAIFITKDSEVYTSSGLKDNFTLTNEAFTLAH